MIIHPEDFKRCLSHFAKGVVVVTSREPGLADNNIGITMDSFNSVSLDPPLVLFSINNTSTSRDILLRCNHFLINILASDQQTLSTIFASKTTNKWNNVEYFLSPQTKNRVIRDCLYYIECEQYANYPGGDHTIILGKVIGLDLVKEGEPLIYYRGQFNSV